MFRPSFAVLAQTRSLYRPQTIKPNPNETPSGKFDRSFEKITSELDSMMPFRQENILRGCKYDRPYGEESLAEMRQAAQDDIFGKEEETLADRQVRSYFTGNDLSPNALRARSKRIKAAQPRQRQAYDKSVVKTTKEPDAYYYPEQTLDEKREVVWRAALGAIVVGLGMLWCINRVGKHV